MQNIKTNPKRQIPPNYVPIPRQRGNDDLWQAEHTTTSKLQGRTNQGWSKTKLKDTKRPKHTKHLQSENCCSSERIWTVVQLQSLRLLALEHCFSAPVSWRTQYIIINSLTHYQIHYQCRCCHFLLKKQYQYTTILINHYLVCHME